MNIIVTFYSLMSSDNAKPNIIKNYFYNLSYKLLAILVPLITTPYIARVLKAESIGAFSYTQSIATYFSIFGIMGLNLYGQLLISKFRDNKDKLSQMFSEILVAKSITSILSTVVYAIFVAIYGQYTSLLTIMGIMVFANIFDISFLFLGLEEFKKIVIRNYIIKLLSLVLILLFIKSEEDVVLYALIIQGSTLLGNVSLWYRIKRYINLKYVQWYNVFIHLKNCLVYFLPTIATTIYTSTDKIMLGAIISSDYQNGIYDQAHKIEQVIITITSAMSTVLLPRLAFLHNNQDKKAFNRYVFYAISITGLLEVPIMSGLFGVAGVLIPVFLGNGFECCITLVRIFSILILFSGLNTIIGDSCLIAQCRQGKYNIGVFAGAAINIVLNVILIPQFASVGAAIASLIAEIIVFVCFLHYTKNEFVSLLSIIKDWHKYFIASIPMGIVVWFIGNTLGISITTLIIQIASGIGIYGVLLLVLRDETTLKLVKKVIKR